MLGFSMVYHTGVKYASCGKGVIALQMSVLPSSDRTCCKCTAGFQHFWLTLLGR